MTWRTWLSAGLLVALVFAVYFNSLNVPYILDDDDSIPNNLSIRNFSTAFSPPSGQGATVSGRPVLNASFALNFAVTGAKPRGFHFGNIIVHALGALVLFGVTRRTLLLPALAGRYNHQQARLLAWFIAALWALHPLQTESVTYTVQRAESLVGLFYLCALYGFIRYAADRSWTWFLLTGSACFLGMGSKEVMATAPFVIFLYDRAFISGSFRAAWQRHCRLYLILLCTLLWLAVLVIGERGRGGSVGVNETVTWWGYLCTQAVAIVRYVWLTFWPAKLTLDYGILVEKNYALIVPCALAVLGGLGATLYALTKRPLLSIFGVWFFCILAPSSSIIPVLTQTVAEHRMYLPLAALVAGFVLIAFHHLGKHCWLVLVPLLILEAGSTVQRNTIYQSEVTIWQDTVEKRPDNHRAWVSLGAFRLHKLKDPAAAQPCFERALQLVPDQPESLNNLGQAYVKLGRHADGIALIEKSIRLAPNNPSMHAGYGAALLDCGLYDQALPPLEKAVKDTPASATLHYNLANTLLNLNRGAEAEPHYLFVLSESPDEIDALNNYGTALRRLGRLDEAIAKFQHVLEIAPTSAKTHNNLGIALIMQGKFETGLHHLRESALIDPTSFETRLNLSRALAQTGHFEEAIAECEFLIQAKPDAELYNNLGALYGQQGRLEKADKAFRAALQLDPNHASARENHNKLRAYLGNRSQ